MCAYEEPRIKLSQRHTFSVMLGDSPKAPDPIFKVDVSLSVSPDDLSPNGVHTSAYLHWLSVSSMVNLHTKRESERLKNYSYNNSELK